MSIPPLPPSVPVTPQALGGWDGAAGYKRLLDLAAPMLVSMGAFTFMMFCDRVFLSWRSAEEIAAAVPATATLWTLNTFFFGTVVYTATFVAQYFGAGHVNKIGQCLWAGVCVAAVGQVLVGLAAVFAEPLFSLFGHAPRVRELEVEYFSIAALGVGIHMTSVALSSVYSGRGVTRPGMWVSCVQALLNIPLNYALIFGEWGAPELGMQGAAISTVASQATGFLIWGGIVFRKENEDKFQLWASRGIPWAMLRRLLRFGSPNGIHFFLDAGAWTAFSLLVGRLGVTQLAGSNIAWQVNTLVLLPVIGIGVATGILVGQFQGAQKSDHAEQAARSGLVLAGAYMAALAALLLLVPELFLWPFSFGAGSEMTEVRDLARLLLRYVAVLGCIQGVQMVYGFSLKGAGDVRYIIAVLSVTASVGFVVPIWWMVERGYSVQSLWTWFVLQAFCVMWILRRRFTSGAWRNIRMIEVDPVRHNEESEEPPPESEPTESQPALSGGA